MSAISPNPFASGMTPTAPGFDFERPGSALPYALDRPYAASDAIGLAPNARRAIGGFGPQADDWGYVDPQTSAGQSAFATLISQFLGSVSSLFAQLGSLFANPPAATGQSQAPGGGETHFENATAGSVGDPHESFAGTTESGRAVGGKWDSMTSHGDLLSSSSFDGGYRIATSVTRPSSNGVTLNDSVSVATDGGQTDVSMQGDGSYDVRSYGSHIELQPGKAVRVDDRETVTKNADGSLTIDDRNGRGGSLTTTLARNGSGGVDVTSAAKEISLGGYLVDGKDGDPDPVADAANAMPAAFDGYAAPQAFVDPSGSATMWPPRVAAPFAPDGMGSDDLDDVV